MRKSGTTFNGFTTLNLLRRIPENITQRFSICSQSNYELSIQMDYECGNGNCLKIVCPNLHVDTSNFGQVPEFQPIGKKIELDHDAKFITK